MDQLDPRSDRPLKLQLTDALRTKIESGEYRPGKKIPSESQLKGQYEVGRNTVRGALEELRKEGLIITIKRVGTIVRPPEDETVVYVKRGAQIAARMPSSRERQDMGIPEGVPLLVIRRKGRPDELHRGDQAVVELQD